MESAKIVRGASTAQVHIGLYAVLVHSLSIIFRKTTKMASSSF